MTNVPTSPEPLLVVDDLRVEFTTDDGPHPVLDGVHLSVARGETLAVVGESGSGKTMTALCVMGLLPNRGRLTAGSITFDGRAITALTEREYCRLRGADLAMIFQDPFASLNPVHWIGDQIAEALLVHGTVSGRKAAEARAVELLERVGVPAAANRAQDFPHQLAGGMRQRVMIAMAIANGPKLLIADEPTTALDVTVQAEVLDLLRSVREATGMSMVLVTHDLGVVAGIADRVAVMYAGRVVESGTVDEVFYEPRHPYTRGLLGSVPRRGVGRRERLPMIPGSPPAGTVSTRCAFAPRCDVVFDRCWSERPSPERVSVTAVGDRGHEAACWRLRESPAAVSGGPTA